MTPDGVKDGEVACDQEALLCPIHGAGNCANEHADLAESLARAACGEGVRFYSHQDEERMRARVRNIVANLRLDALREAAGVREQLEQARGIIGQLQAGAMRLEMERAESAEKRLAEAEALLKAWRTRLLDDAHYDRVSSHHSLPDSLTRASQLSQLQKVTDALRAKDPP